jgi:autotransporter-associated beta strand protein
MKLNTKKYSNILRLLQLGIIPLAATQSLHAASNSWSGTTDGVWATQTNWGDGSLAVPGTTDTATFNGLGNGNVSIDTTGGIAIKSILFDTGAATYTINNQGALAIDAGGDITMTAGVVNAQFVGPDITNPGLLTLSNSAGAVPLTLGGTLAADSLNVNGVFLVNLQGASTVTNATTVSGGTLVYSANGTTGSIVINGGGIAIDDGFTLSGSGASLPIDFQSSNNIDKVTNGILSSGANLMSVNVAADLIGTISAVVSAGSLTKSGAGQLSLSGASTVTGATTVTGGMLQYSSTAATGSGSIVLNGGDATIGEGVTLASNTFTFSTTQSILKTTGVSGPGAISKLGAYVISVAANMVGTIDPNMTYSEVVGDTVPGWTLTAGTGGELILNGQCVPASPTTQKGLITLNGGGTFTINGILSNYYTGTNNTTSKLRIGNTSANNAVEVVGKLRSNSITLGESTFGGNSLVATPTTPANEADPTIRGSGSSITWVIGGASSMNSLTLNAGATMISSKGNGSNFIVIGRDAGGNNNTASVTGAGARWIGTTIKLGINGNNNALSVANGGFVRSEKLLIGTETNTVHGDGNNAVISGINTGVPSKYETETGNNGQFSVGIAAGASNNGASNNYLSIENGGTAALTWSRVGFGFTIGQNNGCDGNYVRVTGVNGATPSSLVSTINSAVTIGGLNVTANSAGVDSTASGNHFDVYSGATATLNQPIHLMGVLSRLNLGDGTGISTLSVGAKSGWTSGVYLQKADARLIFDSGRLTALAAGALVSGPGEVNLDGDAYFSTTQADSTVSSLVTGAGKITKEGSGTLSITSASISAFTGDTVVDNGVLEVTSPTFFGDASDVTIGQVEASPAKLKLSTGATDTVDKLYIDGVQMAAGTYGSSGSAAAIQDDNTFDSLGNGILNVLTGPGGGNAYDTWSSTNSLANPAFDFDSDNDGLANGIEWVLGGNPNANDNPSVLPTVTGTTAGGLTLVFNRSSDSVSETTLVVEWGSVLSGFANTLTIGTTDVGPSGNNPTIDIDAPSVGKVTVNIPAANAVGGKILARLKATRLP